MRKSMALIAVVAAAILSAPAMAGDGKNRRVVVQNNSNESVYNLYASPITSTIWEEDLLGDSTIPAGSSKNANIDNGTTECRYDLKIKMASGREHIRRDVNVCAVSRWIIGPAGNVIE